MSDDDLSEIRAWLAEHDDRLRECTSDEDWAVREAHPLQVIHQNPVGTYWAICACGWIADPTVKPTVAAASFAGHQSAEQQRAHSRRWPAKPGLTAYFDQLRAERQERVLDDARARLNPRLFPIEDYDRDVAPDAPGHARREP